MIVACTAIVAARDLKTVLVTTSPQMHCENCEERIKQGLRFVKGVQKVETDIENQKVYITYDADKTDETRLLKGFEKFGYTARVVTPDEEIVINEDEDCPNM